jgi:hypothetical protein
MPAWDDEKLRRLREERQRNADRLLFAIVALGITDIIFLLLAKFNFDFMSWETGRQIALVLMGVLEVMFAVYFVYYPGHSPRWMRPAFAAVSILMAVMMFLLAF